MAQARIVQREVAPVVPQCEDVVELIMTPGEARVMLQILGGTSGDSVEVSRVYNELRDLELPSPQHKLTGRPGMWTPGNPRAPRDDR